MYKFFEVRQGKKSKYAIKLMCSHYRSVDSTAAHEQATTRLSCEWKGWAYNTSDCGWCVVAWDMLSKHKPQCGRIDDSKNIDRIEKSESNSDECDFVVKVIPNQVIKECQKLLQHNFPQGNLYRVSFNLTRQHFAGKRIRIEYG